jgi:ABC-type uncharacterized transport system substrate-binding protein
MTCCRLLSARLGSDWWYRGGTTRAGPMDQRFLLFIAAGACFVAFTGQAQAHPHVWVTMHEELLYAADGSVTGVHHDWTFDDMFSAFAIQGVAQKQRGTFSREELAPLAKINVESLKEYAYFTYAKVNGKREKDAFRDPTDYYLSYDPKDTVLTLHFTLPFKTPVRSRALQVEIYDPEFFIDFGLANSDAVRLVGAPAQCKLAVEKPDDGYFPKTMRLDQAFSFATSEANIGMGANFANRISVQCS